MPIVQHNPPELFPPYRCYTHATEIRGGSRLLRAAGMTMANLVSLRTYLADPKYDEATSACASNTWARMPSPRR